MHISEGVLNPETLAIGWAVGGAALAASFATLKNDEIPKTAAFSALFFLASSVHISVGVTSAHLLLNGIVGAFLGFRAFAAIGVSLLLQSLLLQFGGITTFGVNLCVLATPALLGFFLMRFCFTKSRAVNLAARFGVGAAPILLGSALLAIVLALNGEGLLAAAYAVFAMHIPIAAIEGVVAVLLIGFVEKVKPKLLGIGR